MEGDSEKRILLIGSHTVGSWVGNKLMAFVLQLHDHHIDAICTAQLSNHTGYPIFYGVITGSKELSDALQSINPAEYSCVIVGYIPTRDLLTVIVDHVKRFRRINSDLTVVANVCFARDFLYVPAEIVYLYKTDMIPLCDIVICNKTELEMISGHTVHSHEDVLRAVSVLHGANVRTVFVRCVVFKDALDTAHNFVSSSTLKQTKQFIIGTPVRPHDFCGVGSLFTAIVVSFGNKKDFGDVQELLERAVSCALTVIECTWKYIKQQFGKKSGYQKQQLELRMIDTRLILEAATITVHAAKVT